MSGAPEQPGTALARPQPRVCGLCGRTTTDWTIGVAVDGEGRQATVLWCRDDEGCLRAHEAVETAALERA